MKLDVSLGTWGGYLRNVGGTARAAEALGFAGLWSSETKHDAFLPLAIAANETEKIELGTSVVTALSAPASSPPLRASVPLVRPQF
jgi:alkanesulfonate monooxygenase SsuD/methylene tetrahydromethanopterin reductase-like flavin-dependent oxidoreductase (luciferase family)